jgi:hypothetical protein
LPLSIDVSVDDDGAEKLQVIRIRPDEAGLVAISYAVEKNALVRRSGERDDDRLIMLVDVTEFGLRLLTIGGWIRSRDFQRNRSVGPVTAVEIAIERADGERYVKVLAL